MPVKHLPNTCQTPNFYIDEVMHLLTGDEFKVLMYTIRRILGFNKDGNQDYISLSQYEHGIKSRANGDSLDYGTGLSRKTIISCLQTLKQHNIIQQVEVPGIRGTKCYKLQVDTELDLTGLENRAKQKKLIYCQRTSNARQAQSNQQYNFKQSVSHTLVNDTHQCVTHTSLSDTPVKTDRLVYGTHQSLVCRTHTQNPEETQKEKNIHVLLAQDVDVDCSPFDNLAEKESTVNEVSKGIETPKQPSLFNKDLQEIEKAAPLAQTKQRSKPKTFNCPAEYKDVVKRIFEFWKVELNHPASLLTPERGNAVLGRLLQGYTEQRIRHAILGCKMSPHNMGQTNGTKYDDLELICRSGSKLEQKELIYLNSTRRSKTIEPPKREERTLEQEAEIRANSARYLREAREKAEREGRIKRTN